MASTTEKEEEESETEKLIRYVENFVIYKLKPNFCDECREISKERNKEPLCMVRNECSKTNETPIFLTGLQLITWNLYLETINLSSTDQFGLPNLDKLEFILQSTDLRLTQDEYDELISYLNIIHVTYINIKSKMMREEWQRKQK